ncbi:hypothetical protein QFC19_007420 [Naganishia cerealis]|uniref:Uncharacterized protein n=1 Tax=Naganishia cerealis TaxID=610337 RepID=A0ACC2VAA1_9TREE|nr:hypothetical protein QFC19_007420 [Naganishia cerealis]
MTIHSLSHPQPQPQVDSTFTRRASDGDIQPPPVATEKILATNGEKERVKMSTGASREPDFSIPLKMTGSTAIAPGSSDMRIAASIMRLNSGHQEPANPAQARSAAAHISVPDSLLPQLADDSRPSADPSLRPLALPANVGQYPGPAGPVIHPVPSEPHSYIAGPEYRPQSRNTTSSITPPNAYELLPHNLYASLHISPQDPHSTSSVGSNSIHSPVGSSQSPVNGGYVHPSYHVTWTPHMPEQGRSIDEDVQRPSEMRHDYGMSQYQRSSTSDPNNQEGSFAGAREYHNNGSHTSMYQAMPDSNMAYMSMHQSLDPQMYASTMLPLTNGFGYQPMYSYYDGRPPTYLQPTANGWMAMQPPVYPFMANPYAGNSWLGVASIFLISRSNCAFVNLKNESNLRMAIAYFNGRSLRPWDSRCQPFLCRIRKADDDLKSGVGGQRGAGLHVKYIKDLRAKENADSSVQKSQIADTIVSSMSNTSESTLPLSPAALEEPPEGHGRRRESVVQETPLVTPSAFAAWQEQQQQQQQGQSSSAEQSYASTCSSFLARNFQKRYFIMKKQAYRTSPEVYLIFGANKQGSFSGYAIMRSGIPAVARKPSSHSSQGQETSLSSHSTRSTNLKSSTDTRHAGLLSPRGADIQEETGDVAEPMSRSFRLPSVDSNPGSLAILSPGEITPGDDLRSPPTGSPLSFKWNQTVPQPDVRQPPNSRETHPRAITFDTKALTRLRAEEALKRELASQAENKIENFEPDKNAALDAQRDTKENDSEDSQNIVRQDMVTNEEKRAPAATQAVSDRSAAADASTGISSPEQKRSASSKDNGNHPNDQHSHMFKVEWIQVGELPFSSIKSLRNPWNQDKEVKVSRDGTELEPTIGAALLDEWSNLQGSTAPAANAVSAHRASQAT